MSDGHNSPAVKSPSVVGRLFLFKIFYPYQLGNKKGERRNKKKKYRKRFIAVEELL
jgi:hypothetical protein